MSYRGSLQQCLTYLGDTWTLKDIEFLSILCHPRAKYYSVETDQGLSKPEYKPDTGDVRLVFRGTRGELRVFMNHPQQDLFKEKLRDPLPDDRQNREQLDRDATQRPTEPTND